jgi:hypothetical protein
MPLKKVTHEQAAEWFAVTNLGGPFIKAPTGGGKIKPDNGEDMHDIYNREYQSVPELEEALPDERKHWLKEFKKPRSHVHGMLAEEGFTVKE